MSGKAETGNGSGMDVFKLGVAAAIVLAGLVGFYVYSDQPLLYRALGIVGAVVAAAVVAYTTEYGRSLSSFMRDARAEVRKMVWPTQTETLQTTIVVFVVVLLLAVFLWIIDRILTHLVQYVI